jgi:hypothetical protein
MAGIRDSLITLERIRKQRYLQVNYATRPIVPLSTRYQIVRCSEFINCALNQEALHRYIRILFRTAHKTFLSFFLQKWSQLVAAITTLWALYTYFLEGACHLMRRRFEFSVLATIKM